MVWFKNAIVYRLTREIEFNVETLEKQLAEFAFHPCGSQDRQKFGWDTALGKYGETFTHVVGNTILLSTRKEEKIIPASVIKDALNEKVEKMELYEGRKLKKSEKDTLKDEVTLDLLPRAFSRHSATCALILADLDLIVVGATSFNRAEDFLALLRKSIGSLPVVPVRTKMPVEVTMTEWVKTGKVPEGYTLGSELDLKAILEEGGQAKLKNQDPRSEEVQLHIENDKLVTKLELDWQERVGFHLTDGLTLKRIKWGDELKDKNGDIDREDVAQRIDADLALVSGELRSLLPSLFTTLGGLDGEDKNA